MRCRAAIVLVLKGTPLAIATVERSDDLVDMYATLNGALVTDLRPEDVEVYEDGVRQSVQSTYTARAGRASTPIR